ncbi:helix-turn-helix domain-containing protein [Cupriavidus metallidurans]|uniref:helix-turn-helix domain-containing protein n=1 Tax=Cupriavidus metallidurans TaxID=119219 RepID=UPI001CCDA90B|nr:AraC family transcriptional regulator [Cupriavidus metallidurans]UBM08053.1 AraC family transcriptional regulator [Cupriavidus metallidurans]
MPKLVEHASPLVEPRRYSPRPFGHAHDYHQLLFGVDGAIELEIDGHAYRVDGQHGLVVPAGAHHVCAGLTENLQLVADFPASSVALPARLMENPRAFAMDASFAARVRALATHRPSGDLPLQHAWHCATALAGNLASALGLDAARNDATHFPAMAIDAWLRANLASPLRVAQLAARMGWGARRFHTLFCEAFGDTPHGYQTRLRLDQAVQWLMAGTMSLADIAYGVGYPDQTTFTRAFARRFGKPPGAWRAAALA